jgi:3-methyladenine DNA glycosylase AlkD
MEMCTATSVKRALESVSSLERAKINAWFFKTGKGEYGEGDEFLGVTVPDQRKVAKEYVELSFEEIQKLLQSKKHEHRLTALLILTLQYKRGGIKEQKGVVSFYLKNIIYVNNWDLVDLSAYHILGAQYVQNGGEKMLFVLAKSKNLWERRIGIIATLAFIRDKNYDPTLKIAEILLHDTEDLMHKAVGWMLREMGKRDKKTLVTFLEKHSTVMPRTMLRYAIERFPKEERTMWLQKRK